MSGISRKKEPCIYVEMDSEIFKPGWSNQNR